MSTEDRAAAYVDNADAAIDPRERASRKTATEVRSRLRRITHQEPFTADWAAQIEFLKAIAIHAKAEDERSAAYSGLPQTPPGATASAAGRGDAADDSGRLPTSPTGLSASADMAGTVWEGDRVVVRVIVEEGKINLLARCLRQYKEAVYAMGRALPTADGEAEQKGKAFEQSIGIIIKHSLYAVECLQTLNLVSLIEHISQVLAFSTTDAYTPDPSASSWAQEVMVIHYLRLIFRSLDRLPTADAVCQKVSEHRVVAAVLQHLAKFKTVVDASCIAAYLGFFAGLLDSEYYKTKPLEFFADKDSKKAFAAAMEPLTKLHLTEHPQDKKLLRPLTDAVIRWK